MPAPPQLAPRLVLLQGPHHNPSADPHHPNPIWPYLQPSQVPSPRSHIWLALPGSPILELVTLLADLAPLCLHYQAEQPLRSSPMASPAGLTSLLRPTSHAAAVEATAAATAAARPLPGSAGNCRKSGAAAGCTSSEGKRPTRPWMVPNLQPRGQVRKGLGQTEGSCLGIKGPLKG